MNSMNPFAPAQDATITVAATIASSQGILPADPATVRIVNNSGALAFLRFGDGSFSADAANDFPMLNGTVEIFDKGSATRVAIILAAGSGSVYITPGSGI